MFEKDGQRFITMKAVPLSFLMRKREDSVQSGLSLVRDGLFYRFFKNAPMVRFFCQEAFILFSFFFPEGVSSASS